MAKTTKWLNTILYYMYKQGEVEHINGPSLHTHPGLPTHIHVGHKGIANVNQ